MGNLTRLIMPKLLTHFSNNGYVPVHLDRAPSFEALHHTQRGKYFKRVARAHLDYWETVLEKDGAMIALRISLKFKCLSAHRLLADTGGGFRRELLDKEQFDVLVCEFERIHKIDALFRDI
jgi:hypothetical protein